MILLSNIRNKRRYKFIAVFVAFSFVNQLAFPIYTYALTGGPSQPEVQSFEPIGTSQMVDLATGDFNYNIPLLDVGGYPVNLAYHAGVGMDQEASWVGLGWNINPGVLNRNMRGLPDDFNGDEIETEQHIKENNTYGLGVGLGLEYVGIDLKAKKLIDKYDPDDPKGGTISLGSQVFYNTYRGVGYEHSLSGSVAVGPLRGRLGLRSNSQEGIDIEPSLSLDGTLKIDEETQVGSSFTIGSSYNSRSGLKSYNLGLNASGQYKIEDSEKAGSARTGTNMSHNFTAQTYVPNISMAQKTTYLSLRATTGGEIFALHGNMSFNGFITTQKLMNEKESKKAYGYIYEQDKYSDDVLLDFNREKDGVYSENTTNLPLVNHTYDVYSASGQGIGGSFRAFRGDVPMLHSDIKRNRSASGQLGLEFGVGQAAHSGGDFTVNWHNSTTGKWKDGNGFWSTYGEVDAADAPIDYEPYYFKAAGEMTGLDEDYYAAVGEDKNVRPSLNISRVDWALHYPDGQTTPDQYIRLDEKTENIKKERESRHQLLSGLDVSHAKDFGLDEKIKDYDETWTYPNNSSEFAHDNIERDDHPDHHFSEMKVKSQDGSTYVYGIPAYNNTTIEKTFNVSGQNYNCSTGQVTYSPGSDNTKSNSRGIDEYYLKKTTPEYAHSYLLTGYTSSDYVDITGNGISDDDIGTAVKFNYSRVHSDYEWRVPYVTNKANFQDGLLTDPTDNKGTYIYGKKEVWHLHSIETKSHVAVFITNDPVNDKRHDAYGVAGENGGLGSNMQMRKLMRIELYSKQDYIRNGTNSVPIKVVHFKYNYSLCDGVENHDVNSGETVKGKLTLEKVYFTYGKSNRGRLSAYEFDYSDINPDYNLKGSDWWGTYKENADNSCGSGNNLSNADFPYTEQDKVDADDNASAWALTEIKLPSGGTINIEYESDDYAYVQDLRAMNMFKILGFGPSEEIGSYSDKTFGTVDNAIRPNEVVYFTLNDPITGSNADDVFYRKYLEGMEEIQFTVFADMNNDDEYEFVKGYANIDQNLGYGLISNGTIGWVALEKVKIGDKKGKHKNRLVSPVTRSIWNFAKLYTPHLVHPHGNQVTGKTKKQLLGLAPLFSDLQYMVKGFNRTLESKKFGHKVKLAKSWIRLMNPDKIKYGGGHRVKKLTMSDNWATMGAANTSAADFEYGQEYFYTTKEKQSDGTEMTISSGVASYEPLRGGDENPFRKSNVIVNELKLAPDNFYLQETPMGESFYPGAVVVYSEVKVQALQHQNVERTATGHTVHEFYTAKEYPTIVEETDIKEYSREPEPFFSLFSFVKETDQRAVQGYTIELNDMHGKPKSQFSYDQEGEQISGSKTFYKSDESGPRKRLDNKVLVIDDEENISEREMGVEVDFAVDNREVVSKTYTAGASVNIDVVLFYIGALPIPGIYPKYSQDNLEFRSVVTTKVIKKYGIVDKTVVFKNGASLESENMLYDEETGVPLLSKTQNEFKDFTYSYTYPAYWAYNEMGPAYRNHGLHVNGVTLSSLGNITFPNSLDVKDYLVPGDRCILTDKYNTSIEVYVHDGLDGVYNLIDKDGWRVQLDPAANCTYAGVGPFSLKVIESAYANTTTAPMASVITHTNPLVQSGQTYSLVFNDVLDASAVEYKDDWQTQIDYFYYDDCQPNSLKTEWLDALNCLLDGSKGATMFEVQQDNLFLDPALSAELKKVKGAQTTYPDSYGNLKFDSCDDIYYRADNTAAWEQIDPDEAHELSSRSIDLYSNASGNETETVSDNSCLDAWFGSSDLLTAIEDKILENFPGGTTQTDLNNSTNASYYVYVENELNDGALHFKVDFHHTTYHVGCPLEFWVDNRDREIESIESFDDFFAVEEGEYLVELTVNLCGGTQETRRVQLNQGCLNMFDCSNVCHKKFVEDQVNPYTSGLAGNWRAYVNHKYLGERNYSASVDPKDDGTYQTYDPFWTYNATNKTYEKNTTGTVDQWVSASEITKITPFGNEVENKDALGNYSSAVYGYEHSVPKAVANNAKYEQIAYDGFEDYQYMNEYSPIACEFDHWSYRYRFTTEGEIDDEVSHTGNLSLKVYSGQEVYVDRELDPTVQTKTFDENYVRKVKLADDIGLFKPETGDYLLSAWIKEDRDADHIDFTGAKIQVEITKSDLTTVTYDINASGKIIEGWQRLEGEFPVPAGAKKIRVKLVSTQDVDAWFDDIRIFPKKGNIKTFAYDARTLRLMAELDENNYATFYEYDEEGTLIRLKKETVNGISTLKENRNHYYKATSP